MIVLVVVEANILYLKRDLRLQSQRDAETHLQFRNIITKGQINEKSEDDISNIINSLKKSKEKLLLDFY